MLEDVSALLQFSPGKPVESRQLVDRFQSNEFRKRAADHRSMVDQLSEFGEKGFEGHDGQPSLEP